MLNLPNDIEELARLVALKTGTTPEGVVIEAVKAFARAVGVHDVEIIEAHRVAMMEAAKAIARRSAARPVRDARSDDDIVGYKSHEVSQNQAIQLVAIDMELTENQAAEFLQVPIWHLVKLIQAGKLPCRIVGTHRLITLIDLMTYRLETEAVSGAAREQMTRDAEAHDWGY